MKHVSFFPLLVGFVLTSHCLAADGWLGFFPGQSPDEYRESKTIHDSTTLSWLEPFEQQGRDVLAQSAFHGVDCEGVYRHHLQGICTNESDRIFWCFTTTLVTTDASGKVVRKIPVENHHGDLCYHDGKLYVAVNHGRFNDPQGKADSWVYVYDAGDLSFVSKHETPEVFHGAGGIAYHGKRFIVIGGLPDGVEENYAYEYDPDFAFVKKHVINSGHTRLGIQTAAYADGHWWFGCYGSALLKTDASFKLTGRYNFDCGIGIAPAGAGRFLVGRGGRTDDGRTGSVLLAHSDEKRGLVVQKKGTQKVQP